MRITSASGLGTIWLFFLLSTLACAMPQALFKPSLKAGQAGTPESFVPPPPPPALSDSVSVRTSRVTGPAPLSVLFDATATTSALSAQPFHFLQYTWSFGDPAGGATWASDVSPGLVSKNFERGPLAAHLFETPGTYNVVLSVYDGVSTTTTPTPITVTVTAPNTVYAGTNTVYIANGHLPSAADVADGVAAGALYFNETTWAGVISRIVPGKRILLRKGDSWSTSTSGYVPSTVSATPTQIGSYGASASPPQVTISGNYVTAFGLFNTGSHFTFMDLDFVGTAGQKTQGVTFNVTTGIDVIRCNANLVGTPIKGQGASRDMFFQENNFHDMSGGAGNLGIWVQDSDHLAVLGTKIINAKNIEHNLRTQGVDQALYAHNHFSNPGATKHALAIRGKISPLGWLQKVVVSDNFIDSDGLFVPSSITSALVQVAPQNSASYEPIQDVLIEGNVLSGDWYVGVQNGAVSGVTVRNNLMTSTHSSAIGMEIGYGNPAGTPVPTDVRFDNNSLYFTGSSATGVTASGDPTHISSGIKIRNNLLYAPGAGTTHTIYTGYAGITDFLLQTNSSNAQALSTNPGWSPLGSLDPTKWVPTDAYTIGSGTTIELRQDFGGAARSAPYDLGAVNH